MQRGSRGDAQVGKDEELSKEESDYCQPMRYCHRHARSSSTELQPDTPRASLASDAPDQPSVKQAQLNVSFPLSPSTASACREAPGKEAL